MKIQTKFLIQKSVKICEICGKKSKMNQPEKAAKIKIYRTKKYENSFYSHWWQCNA